MWPFKKVTKIEDYPEEMDVHFRITERDSVHWPLRVGLWVEGREVDSEIAEANRKHIERQMRKLEENFSDYKNGGNPRFFVGCYDRASVSQEAYMARKSIDLHNLRKHG